jgi:hypothetical protein
MRGDLREGESRNLFEVFFHFDNHTSSSSSPFLSLPAKEGRKVEKTYTYISLCYSYDMYICTLRSIMYLHPVDINFMFPPSTQVKV